MGLSRSTVGDDRMTQTGSLMGTPAFMSPEQARGAADLDIRGDIYSLGASLHTLLTGQKPYAGATPMAIAAGVILQPFPDTAAACPGLDAALCALIRRCTAKAREERPQTPGELVSALNDLLPRLEGRDAPPRGPAAAGGAAARAPSPRRTASPMRFVRGHGLGLLLVLAGMLLAGMGLAIWWFGYDSPRREAERGEKERLTDTVRRLAMTTQQLLLQRISALPETADDGSLADVRAMIDGFAADHPPADLAGSVQAAWRAKCQAVAAARTLAAIAACPAGVDAAQLEKTRQLVDGYLAGHAQEPQAAVVKERWRLVAEESSRRHAAQVQAEARGVAATEQAEVLRLIAELGGTPTASSMAEVRAKVEGYVRSNAPEDLRQEVRTAWDAKQQALAKALASTRESEAMKEPWMANMDNDAYGTWAEFAVGGAVQRMRWIKPGTFIMGSPPNEELRGAEEWQHQVTLTKGFWLGDSSVTQGLWQVVMAFNPSEFRGDANRPVESIS